MTRPTASSLRLWPWYPTLIAVGLVLTVFADYPILITSGIRALAMPLVAGATVTAIWVALLGRDRGGMAAALTIAGLIGAHTWVGVLMIVAAIALLAVERAWRARGTMRLRIPWSKITSILNLVLLVFGVLQVGRAVAVRLPLQPPPRPATWAVSDAASRPDIFLILADGHGRADVLADRYGYDSGAFARAMSAAGFDEAPDSYANHSVTRFSLAVLLNGRPLSELGQDMSQGANGDAAFTSVLGSSSVGMLEAAGYETTVVSSGFDHVPLHDVDHYVDVGPRNEFEQAVWGNLAIGQALDGQTDAYAVGKRERILRELDVLHEIAQGPAGGRPQFVLAHLSAPHFPMVMNEDCSLRPGDEYTLGSQGRQDRAGDAIAVEVQAAQTRCLDTLIAEAARDLATTRPDAVVVIFSDHGPEEGLDWWAPDVGAVHDRMANLFWARTPGRSGLFPDDVTLVNIMPIIANSYLGTGLPLHPNDLFFGPTRTTAIFVPYLP